MKIYTRTGDDGSTALFGGDRVLKTHPRIEACGTVDEINAWLGMARALAADHPESETTNRLLTTIQEELLTVGADLATPIGTKARPPRIGSQHVERLEEGIDALEEELPPLRHFILPGGTKTASALHVARSICRRAERLAIGVSERETINATVSVYLNRLSDYLFVLARWAHKAEGGEESRWRSSE